MSDAIFAIAHVASMRAVVLIGSGREKLLWGHTDFPLKTVLESEPTSWNLAGRGGVRLGAL